MRMKVAWRGEYMCVNVLGVINFFVTCLCVGRGSEKISGETGGGKKIET